jgi:hypothetical protein
MIKVIKIGFAFIAKISIILLEVFVTDAKSPKQLKLYIITIQILSIVSNVIMLHIQLNLFYFSIISKAYI